MTYFNPETYDWKKLRDDDAIYIDGYNDCMDDMIVAFDNLITACDFDGLPVLEQICVEIKDKFAHEVANWIESSRIQKVVSIMDGNDKYEET